VSVVLPTGNRETVIDEKNRIIQRMWTCEEDGSSAGRRHYDRLAERLAAILKSEEKETERA